MPSDTDANLNVRLDRDLKASVEAVLRAIGTTVPDTIRCFLVRVANDRALPFELWRPADHEIHVAARTLDYPATASAGKATIHIRIDRRLKAASEAILRAAGTTTSHALRCLFVVIVRQRRVPFSLWEPTDAEIDTASLILERTQQLKPGHHLLFQPTTPDQAKGRLKHHGPPRTLDQMTRAFVLATDTRTS